MVPDYQAFMRGVDRGDQLMGYYNIRRRSRKWWKRVFGYVVEVAALNAYVIQKDGYLPAERKKHDYLEFRVALAEEHLPTIDGSSRMCVVCSKVREVKKLKRSEYRHETQIKCGVCDVNLCVTKDRNCFVKYHTCVRYWE